MATAAILGGATLAGTALAGLGASAQAKKQAEAAQQQLAAAQQFQQSQQEIAGQFIPGAAAAQQAQLGILGIEGGDPQAAQQVLTSPLVQALQEQNQRNIEAQAIAGGVGAGGNLLSALQQQNTATLLQAGLQGLGGIAGQGAQIGLGFTGQAGQGLGLAQQAMSNLGAAQGAQAALPALTAANMFSQGAGLASFGLGGGFGSVPQLPQLSMPRPQAAPVGGGGTLQQQPTINQFGVL